MTTRKRIIELSSDSPRGYYTAAGTYTRQKQSKRYVKGSFWKEFQEKYGLQKSWRAPLTSQANPIRVDTFPHDALPLPGKLGMTFSPGKKQEDGVGGHHHRHLATDLTRLRTHYGVNVVVSLIEDFEFKELHTPDLLKDIERSGMRAVWFPIPDMDAPKRIRPVLKLVEDLYQELKAGHNVMVHCKGGLGRTGTIAACILVRARHTPENAIAWARYVRQGTVQTKVQENFVERFSKALWGENKTP